MQQPVRGLCLVCLFAVTACVADTSEGVSGSDQTLTASDDLQLQDVMNLPGVRSVRPVQPSDLEPVAAGRMAVEVRGAHDLVGVTTRNGTYVLEVDPAELAAESHELYGPGGSAPPGGRAPRGLSDGVDNRTRITGAGLVTSVVYISTWLGGCTGTLIGGRIVRTAMHCFVSNSSTGVGVLPPAGSTTVFLRTDGSAVASGTDQTMIWPGAYCSSGCCRSSSTDPFAGYHANRNACTWKDWAYIILAPNWNNGNFFQFMGYRMLNSNALGTRFRMNGYPDCNKPAAPGSCVAFSQYEDRSTTCTLHTWTSSPSKWRSNCDVSYGQSGGPIYDSSAMQLIGHSVDHECDTCPAGSPNRSAPNHFLGHDQWLFDLQNSLRTQYP